MINGVVAGTPPNLRDASATIKPADFLTDFCKVMGYTMFFDERGVFNLVPQENLIRANFQVLDPVQNVSFKYADELVFSGVEVGYDSPSIDYPLFRQQFAEKLTYLPNQKGGEVAFDLVVNSLRIDYAGILLQRYDFEQRGLQGDPQRQYKDVWIVQVDHDSLRPYNRFVTTSNLLGGGVFNVFFSPRRMLQRFLRYFSSIFGVWSHNPVLVFQADENMQNDMISRMTLAEDPGLQEKQPVVHLTNYDFTPIEVRFDTFGRLSDIHVLQRIRFDYEGRTYNAIVKEVSTTNRLEKLEITALLTEKILKY